METMTIGQLLRQTQPGHGLRLMLTELHNHQVIPNKWWTFKELLGALQ